MRIKGQNKRYKITKQYIGEAGMRIKAYKAAYQPCSSRANTRTHSIIKQAKRKSHTQHNIIRADKAD